MPPTQTVRCQPKNNTLTRGVRRHASTLSLAGLLAGTLLAGSTNVWANSQAHRCNLRFDDTLVGELRARQSPLEVDVFELGCTGHIHARLRLNQGKSAWILAELSWHDGQAWKAVDHGHNIVFRAQPGRYRYRLIHNGPADSTLRWKLHWSKPR